MSQKQQSNGLTKAKRSSNNGDDYFSASFYAEVIEASQRFWSNTQVSHFVNGVAIRTDIPRRKPNANGFNGYEYGTKGVPKVVRG